MERSLLNMAYKNDAERRLPTKVIGYTTGRHMMVRQSMARHASIKEGRNILFGNVYRHT